MKNRLHSIFRLGFFAAAALSAAAAFAHKSGGVSHGYSDASYPLSHAVMHNDIAEAKRLIAAGAAVSPRNKFYTPLRYVKYDTKPAHISMIKVLLDGGANPNLHLGGKTPLPLFRAMKNNSPKVVQMLLAAGANPNAKSGGRITPLMLSADSGNLPIMKMLLAAKADPNAADSRHRTVLGRAIQQEKTAAVKMLLDTGANPNQTHSGKPPLHFAIDVSASHKTRLAFMKLLLANGANPNTLAKADLGRLGGADKVSPLMRVAMWSAPPLAGVTILLNAGADPHLKDSGGWNALDYAKWRSAPYHGNRSIDMEDEQEEIVEILGKAGVKSDPVVEFFLAVTGGDDNGVEKSLAAGVEPDSLTPRWGDQTPLSLAVEASKRYLDDYAYVVQLLLEAGANPNDPSINASGVDEEIHVMLEEAGRNY